MGNTAILEALGKTLLDSIAQGLIILLIAMVVLWILKEQSAKYRHAILLLCLLALPVLSIYTFVKYNEPKSGAMVTSINAQLSDFDPIESFNFSDSSLSTEAAIEKEAFVPPSKLVWLSYAWMLGILLYLVRISGSFFYLNRLNKLSVPNLDKAINNRLESLRADFGIGRAILLKTSERIGSPLVYGFFKPVIIFPLGLIQGLTSEEVEVILLHELSHLKRNDFVINIVVNVLKTVYFYHPAFWWLSTQLDNEMEFATDEMVLKHRPDHLSIIKALSKTQEYNMSVSAIGFAGSSKHQLLKRVNRIMKKQQKPNWLGGLLALMILASAFLLTSQQSKENVDKTNQSEKERIDSVLFKDYDPKLDISERDTLKPFLLNLPVFKRVNDSLIYSHTLVSNFGNDTLSVEKALAEIVQKKQKFMLEKLENGEITNVTRGRSELKGDSLKVYKQAFEMLEGYAEENKTDNNRKASLDNLRKLEEYNRQIDEQLLENQKEEYQELVERYNDLQSSQLKEVEKRQQLIELKRQLIQKQSSNTSEQNLKLIKELEALEGASELLNEDFNQFDMERNLQSYIERLENISQAAESYDNPKMVKELESRMYESKKKLDAVQRANYKEQVALKSRIGSQLSKVRASSGKEKVAAIEKLLFLLNDNLSQSLDQKEREETQEFIQEARQLLKAYYEQVGEQEKVEALREKMEQELEIRKDMTLPENLSALELDMMASTKKGVKGPLIWVTTENANDTIKAQSSLGDLELQDVIEFKVYPYDKAIKLDPAIEKGSGVIFIVTTKQAFNRYKRDQQKRAKEIEVQNLKIDLEAIELDRIRVSSQQTGLKPSIWLYTKSKKDTLVLESLEDLKPGNIEEIKVFKGEAADKLMPDGKGDNGIIVIEVNKSIYQKFKKTSKKLKRD